MGVDVYGAGGVGNDEVVVRILNPVWLGLFV